MKYLITILILLLIILPVSAKQLWQYDLFSKRAKNWQEISNEKYQGTYEQNLRLLDYYEQAENLGGAISRQTGMFMLGNIYLGGNSIGGAATASTTDFLSTGVATTTRLFNTGAAYTTNLIVSKIATTTTICLTGDTCRTTWPTSSSGAVSTSTNETAGYLSYWTSNSATPALLGQVATTTLTATAPIVLSNPISVIGGSASVATCNAASGSQAGCLSAANWNAFNNKWDLASSTIGNAYLTDSTISGVALGGSLFALTNDTTLNGSSYNGSGAISDWGLNLANDNTWTGAHTFAATSTFNGLPVNQRIINSFTASTTIAAGQAVYMATSTGAIQLANASYTASSTYYQFLGLAVSAAVNGETVYVQTAGIVPNLSLTKGLDYYVGNTAGTISSTMGNVPLMIGRAISATQLLIDRQKKWGLSEQYVKNAATSTKYTDGEINYTATTDGNCDINRGTDVISHASGGAGLDAAGSAMIKQNETVSVYCPSVSNLNVYWRAYN